ncbi:MAG TPA: four-helix bundle copper-binding protein [Nevskia sp.]|nr:four-helix bundle copper-binding protein [Nevskia sp.]
MKYQPKTDGQDPDACIRACVECHAMCLKTASYCMERGKAPPGLIVMLQVCADICRVSADTMIRGSDLHGIVCGACAEVCASCAAGCEQLAGNAQADECRQVCLRCFDLCSAMAAEMS